MNITIPVLLLLLTLVLSTASPASGEDTGLSRLFSDRKVTGTLVITNLEGTITYIHNEVRANAPFLPASTFKIPNTLIALDEGAITESGTLKWDGKDRGVAAWNRDQALDTAFKTSCVWFYQELARRIGTAAYEAYLKKIGYGNALPAPELTTFWLEGNLRISAMEQIAFLKKLHVRQLPFKPASYETLKRIMMVDQTRRYTMWAKTGWAQRVSPQIGWYVGYVESDRGTWFFAVNMNIDKPQDASFRQQIVMEALRMKGIIDG